MPSRTFVRVLLGLCLLFPLQSYAVDCSAPRSFDSHQKENSSPKVLILPFQGDPETATVLTVLFKEYLGLAKDLNLLPIPAKSPAQTPEKTPEKVPEKIIDQARNAGAQYALTGRITASGGERNVDVLIVSTGTKKQPAGEAGRLKGSFHFNPEQNSLNELMAELVEKASEILHAPLKEKKILPFLNTTHSMIAYQNYSVGMMSLDSQGPELQAEALLRAVQAFEKASQEDYNYVPAYRGLAEAYAALAALTTNGGMSQKAQIAWTKAKLLNPVVTKIREDRIEWYLKADAKDLCGGGK